MSFSCVIFNERERERVSDSKNNNCRLLESIDGLVFSLCFPKEFRCYFELNFNDIENIFMPNLCIKVC